MMKSKTVRRTLKVRHSAVPRRSRSASKSPRSFAGMFAMLTAAGARLELARPRR